MTTWREAAEEHRATLEYLAEHGRTDLAVDARVLLAELDADE